MKEFSFALSEPKSFFDAVQTFRAVALHSWLFSFHGFAVKN
jgi:hypothetical protein